VDLRWQGLIYPAGIYLNDISHCNISNNNASNNYYGILLNHSSNNVITNNIAKSNNNNGICLWMSSNNNIITHNIASNNWAGVLLDSSLNNNIASNSVSNNSRGIFLNSYSNNNVVTNNIALNNYIGIFSEHSSNNDITNNNASSNHDGISLGESSNNNNVTNNTCNSNAEVGISLWRFSNDNTVANNIANSNSYCGIRLDSSSNNNITNNDVTNSGGGIWLISSSNNSITNNNALNNHESIYLGSSSSNVLTNNKISNNDLAIFLSYSNSNNIYLNNFIKNSYNIDSYNSTNIWNSTEKITYTYNGNTHTNYLGNYWDDYTDVDADNDGIWDNPYSIDSDKDYHPLVYPFENYVISDLRLQLAEDLETTVNHTLTCLNGIVEEAWWSAEAGDYFAKDLKGKQVDTIIDFIFGTVDLLCTISDKVEDVVDLQKVSLSGSPESAWSRLLWIKHTHEDMPALFRSALLHTGKNPPAMTKELLQQTFTYYAADLTDKAIDEVGTTTAKVILKEQLKSDLALQEQFVPSLEKVVGAFKSHLVDTKSEVLANAPDLTSEEIELYKEDLKKRRLANIILLSDLNRQALPLHLAQDIKESEEGDWKGNIQKFLLKNGLKCLVWIPFDGPGVLLTSIATFTWETCQNKADLESAAQMMDLGVSVTGKSLDTSKRVYLNTMRGLENIEHGLRPQIAEGEIVSINNVVIAELKDFFGKDYLFVKEAYSDVVVSNTGTSDTIYELTAEYGKWGILGTSYTPIILQNAKKIDAGKNRIVRIYYKDSHYGDAPPEGTEIQLRLLGTTDTGTYYVDSNSTVFGTQKIISSQDSVEVQKAIEESKTLPYPITSAVERSLDSMEYALKLFVENPFNESLSANLTQEVPLSLTITDTNNGTFKGNVISWHLDLKPEEKSVIAVTFTCEEEPGATVKIPGAVLSIYDAVNDAYVGFQTDPCFFKVKFAIVVEAYPPSKASLEEDIIVPLNLTNLLSNDTLSGNIITELLNSEGVVVYNSTEEISLAPEEIRRINLIATPDVDPGVYVIRGTWQEGTASINIFREVISIDATSVFGMVLLGGQSNHRGSMVRLGNYTTITNPDGSYLLTAVPAGNYSLNISHASFLSFEGNVTISAEGLTIIPQVTLSPWLTAELGRNEVVRGGGVNVSGEAPGNVVDVVAIGPRGLRKMPRSFSSEMALADGIRFVTVRVTENNTYEAEIRIPEEAHLGFHQVMALSPGGDGVYGATTRRSGELLDAILDYVSSVGGSMAVLPGKSSEQLMEIISAATFDMAGSDDLIAGPLEFTTAIPFGAVIQLDPIAPVGVGEPLVVNGEAELEDDAVVFLSVISGPADFSAYTVVRVEEGKFSATFDTLDAVPGTYVMKAEDVEGNIDIEPFEILDFPPTPTPQVIEKIKTRARGEEICFDMPRSAIIGETVYVKGVTTASGNVDIVIDDILMADNLPIDSDGAFEWKWNTRKPLPGIGAYTPGLCVIKAYLNCHVSGVSVGDYVRTAYKHLDVGDVVAMRLVSPEVAAELNVSTIAKGDSIAVQGMAPGADTVDIVIIGPKGLNKLPNSFTSEVAIDDGLFFTSAEVAEDYTFEKSIRIPGETDSGNYQLLVFTPGRDGLYALTMREEGELFNALLDYGWTANDFVGRNQTQLMRTFEEATFSSPGSDDFAVILSFEVEYSTRHVDNDFKDYPDANFSSIQDAVNFSSNGDIIIVHNGTYVENVNVNKSITIKSDCGAEDTIVQAKNQNDHVFGVIADYVDISGFTVKGATSCASKAGIHLYYADYCTSVMSI